MLEVPEGGGRGAFGGNIARARDVDDGAGADAGGEEEGGELDEMDGLSGGRSAEFQSAGREQLTSEMRTAIPASTFPIVKTCKVGVSRVEQGDTTRTRTCTWDVSGESMVCTRRQSVRSCSILRLAPPPSSSTPLHRVGSSVTEVETPRLHLNRAAHLFAGGSLLARSAAVAASRFAAHHLELWSEVRRRATAA